MFGSSQEMKIFNFVKESNMIENIHRDPTTEELEAFMSFTSLEKLDLTSLCEYVEEIAKAEIRSGIGMNVYVGTYTPPSGGSHIVARTQDILGHANDMRGETDHEDEYCFDTRDLVNLYQKRIDNAFWVHQIYEHTHPFMDGNGRSGRAIWYWMMRGELGGISFLHRWYYSTLSNWRVEHQDADGKQELEEKG